MKRKTKPISGLVKFCWKSLDFKLHCNVFAGKIKDFILDFKKEFVFFPIITGLAFIFAYLLELDLIKTEYLIFIFLCFFVTLGLAYLNYYSVAGTGKIKFR
ncbi:MAG: hypothetical protein LBU76_06065 [Azoarcus sp.]|jgi:hypothetical protein|nr:hypothetical protein [Azoarcus sp.]